MRGEVRFSSFAARCMATMPTEGAASISDSLAMGVPCGTVWL
jgi:hypothetical protein